MSTQISLLALFASMAFAQEGGSTGGSTNGSAGGAAAGGGGGGGGGSDDDDKDTTNDMVQSYMLIVWGAIAFAFIVYQFVVLSSRYIRTVACLNNDSQRFFAVPYTWYGYFKQYLFDAPLFRLRHHREFKLSSAINCGTLPSRFQSLFLVIFFALNITFVVWDLPWHLATSDLPADRKQIWDVLYKRAGVMSIINMIPLFIFAGRNNPLLYWTGISFDTFNLFHRWLGRIVTLQAIIHTIFWMVKKVQGAKTSAAGWKAVVSSLGGEMQVTGIVGTAAVIIICIQASSPLRHAFYEFFLHFHQLLVIAVIVAMWLHIDDKPFSFRVLQTVVGLWVSERGIRLIRIAYRNFGRGGTKATIELLPGDAVRVTIRLARPWQYTPGQHAYIYLPRIGWWTNHPFTIAWSEEETDLSMSDEKLAMTRQDVLSMQKSTMSMIIRTRTGFTNKLYSYAERNGAGKFTTNALIEGPYGSQSHHSYGTVLLFAAGVGITHQVPHVRDLVIGYSNNTAATRRITLVWIIQSPEHLEWIRPWMTSILGLPKRRDVLKILLFVTRPRSTKEIHSPSSSVQMFPGKPNIAALVDSEVENRVGAMCVSVCGTGSLADDARRATRRWMGVANVDFAEESFSW